MKTLISFIILSALSLSKLDAQSEQKTFEKVERIKTKFVSGNLSLKKSPDNKTHISVQYTFSPASYQVTIEENSGSVQLKENFSEGNNRGEANWVVQLPDGVIFKHSTASGNITIEEGLNIELTVSTASGSVAAENCKGNWKINTASGDLSFKNHTGELDLTTASGTVILEDYKGNVSLSSASGDVILKNCAGEISGSSASGNVKVSNCKLTGSNKFSSASGNVKVTLAYPLESNLSVSSASGSVSLDLNGQPANATMQIITHKKKKNNRESASISSPFKYDSVDEKVEDEDITVIRTTKLGAGEKKVELSSASGRITITK